MNIFGYQIDLVLAGIILALIGGIIALLAWIRPLRARLAKDKEEKIDQIPILNARTEAIAESLKRLESIITQKPYLDGLASAPPPVFDPFAKGLELMAQSKWDEAIAEFKESMKEAKGSQLVALYNLIGLCYYTPGKLDSALSSYNKSLELARQFADSMGQANALGNIGLIYQDKGDLDAALKYLEEAHAIFIKHGLAYGRDIIENAIAKIKAKKSK